MKPRPDRAWPESPRDNRALMNELLDRGALRLEHARWILDGEPAPLPVGSRLWRKAEGMLLGLAIGDALGNTTESQLPHERRARHGEIRDYLPHPHAGGRALGLPSDDTQMAFWTLESALEQGGLDPERLAERFCRERIFGIGSNVREFVGRFKDQRIPWHEAGPESAGNGALMRIAPVLVPHLATAHAPSSELWADVVLAASLTHNDRASTAACVAFVSMLWRLLAMRKAPAPEWWLDAYCEMAAPLEGETRLASRNPRVPYEGPIWRLVDTQVREALHSGESVLDAGNRWYSGAYLLETVPTALHILALHGHDPEEAIVRAVNDTRDNDTIAAIVGAAMGALHGRSALPQRWVRGLLGRTGAEDDGRVQALITAARDRWFVDREPVVY